jgi:hypothetical protein
MNDEFRENNLKEWDDLLNNIFQGQIPESRSWTEKKEIIKILQLVGGKPNSNHTFLPEGGGLDALDLKGADESAESDCIELHFVEKPACILKPRVLIFQSFDKPYEWAYFRLETEELDPSGWYEHLTGIREELTELHPGEYIHRSYWEAGCYEFDETGKELPLPNTARIVFRYFSGSFVIFAKASTYNEINSTGGGRHSKMTEEEFKEYIGGKVRRLRKERKIQ